MSARAHWLRRDLLALPARALPTGLPAEHLTWSLAAAADGGIDVGRLVTGPQADVEELALRLDDGTLPGPVADAWPHLATARPLGLARRYATRAEDLLRGQVALLGRDPGGTLLVATSLQIPGVLDDL